MSDTKTTQEEKKKMVIKLSPVNLEFIQNHDKAIEQLTEQLTRLQNKKNDILRAIVNQVEGTENKQFSLNAYMNQNGYRILRINIQNI